MHEVTHSKTTTLVPETDAVRLADVASAAAVPVPTPTTPLRPIAMYNAGTAHSGNEPRSSTSAA